MKRLYPLFLFMVWLCQVEAFQLPNRALYPYQCKDCASLSHQTLTTSWLIDDKNMVPATAKAVKSNRFYKTVTGHALKEGVDLGLLADGAVVRITPLNPAALPKGWQQKLVLKTKRQTNPLAEQAEFVGDEQEFKQQFSVGPAVIFQLKPGLFKQAPHLAYADDTLQSGSQWQLSVYDRNSNLYLSLSLDKINYATNEVVKAVIDVNNDFSVQEVNWLEARVIGPNGQDIFVDLSHDNPYSYFGQVPVSTQEVTQGENWYFVAMADLTVNGSHTIRSVQAAFSYVVPSAKVRALYRQNADEPFHLTARVESIQASRYQFQAVVYATGKDGQRHAVALAQTSAWLDPGVHELPIIVDNTLPSNMHPPYYLGLIELVDDAQLKPVYRYNDVIPLTKLDVE